jgi:[acyl-carrier-protein] S-malonyltransferase
MSKLAYVFPGQGSQQVGMLAGAVSEVADTFAEASSVLGYDLWSLVSSGPDEKLNQTEFTQPALLTASIALFRLARQAELAEPQVVAGHSLGEYAALVAAGVIEFADAVALVQKRGQFMQTAVPVGEGGMAAVLGLDDDLVTEICAAASGDELAQAVNFNAPGQVVIAGTNAALERAIEGCKQAGARRAMPLAVSAPFHSEMMKPAAEQMAMVLAEVHFSEPRMEVVQNVDADVHSEPDEIRDNLVRQMYNAVLWTQSVQKMKMLEVSRIIECGPGKVLTGLSKRIDKSLEGVNIDSPDAIAALKEEQP